MQPLVNFTLCYQFVHILTFIILLAIKVFTFVVIRNYTLAANNCKSSSKVYTFETVNSGLFSE